MAVYSTLVRESGCEVERLGMDENWVDVTRLVKDRQRQEGQSASDLNRSAPGTGLYMDEEI